MYFGQTWTTSAFTGSCCALASTGATRAMSARETRARRPGVRSAFIADLARQVLLELSHLIEEIANHVGTVDPVEPRSIIEDEAVRHRRHRDRAHVVEADVGLSREERVSARALGDRDRGSRRSTVA